jgi:hypothetical protein
MVDFAPSSGSKLRNSLEALSVISVTYYGDPEHFQWSLSCRIVSEVRESSDKRGHDASYHSVRKAEKLVNGWKQARPLRERWRRELKEVDVELKQPRVIDPLPTDSASSEPIENGNAASRFRGEVIYFADADAMVRLPSGAMLVLDNGEIAAMSDGKNRCEL